MMLEDQVPVPAAVPPLPQAAVPSSNKMTPEDQARLMNMLRAGQIKPIRRGPPPKGSLPKNYEWNPITNQAQLIPGLPEPQAKPQKREYLKAADGRYRWLDTGDLVFPDQKPVEQEQFKVPANYMLNENKTGVMPIPGGPADVAEEKKKPLKLSGESAGRYAAVKQALAQDLPLAKALAFEADGDIAGSNLWPAMSRLNPFSDQKSVQLRNAMRRTINAILRMESGAVVSDAEIDDAMDFYMPGMLDSNEVAHQKMAALETRARNALSAIEGSESPAVAQPLSGNKYENMSIEELEAEIARRGG